MDKQVQETYASDDVRSIPLLDRVKAVSYTHLTLPTKA